MWVSDWLCGERRRQRHTQLEGRFLDVEDDCLDVLGREMVDEELAYSIAPSGDDDELFLPVPAIARPVVQNASVQVAIDPARNAPIETCLQAAQG